MANGGRQAQRDEERTKKKKIQDLLKNKRQDKRAHFPSRDEVTDRTGPQRLCGSAAANGGRQAQRDEERMKKKKIWDLLKNECQDKRAHFPSRNEVTDWTGPQRICGSAAANGGRQAQRDEERMKKKEIWDLLKNERQDKRACFPSRDEVTDWTGPQ